jgi:D-alanyl-D-alanine carboxypeptidase
MGVRVRIGLAVIAALISAGPAPVLAQVSTQTAGSTAPAAGFVENARAAVRKYADAGTFSGVVLVARDGKPVFREAFGLAERDPDAKATPETVYYIGSLTKQFTAAAILRLADAGKLGIDDPVSKYYAKAPAAWSKITIRHLLSHRSGIPNYTALPGYRVFSRTDTTPEELIARTRDMPLEFEPGAKFVYSNSGYAVLGYIIEKASGQEYADYLKDHIFKPLGMKNSGYGINGWPPFGLAEGFDISAGALVDAAPISMTVPYAAGALYSTADDMLIWDRALSLDKVMSKTSRTQMETNQGTEVNGYGFGVQVFVQPKGHPSIRHSGAMNGFESTFYRFVQDGVTIVVLGNTRPGPAVPIAEALMRAYFGMPEPAPPLVVKPEVLARYVGVYELQPGVDVTLSVKDGRLYSQATGQPGFALLAVSDRDFRYPSANIKAEFPPGDGPVPSFTLTQGGPPREIKRKAN